MIRTSTTATYIRQPLAWMILVAIRRMTTTMDSRIVAKSNGVRRTEGIGSLTTVRRGIWMDPTIRLRCWHGCSHYREEEASVVCRTVRPVHQQQPCVVVVERVVCFGPVPQDFAARRSTKPRRLSTNQSLRFLALPFRRTNLPKAIQRACWVWRSCWCCCRLPWWNGMSCCEKSRSWFCSLYMDFSGSIMLKLR